MGLFPPFISIVVVVVSFTSASGGSPESAPLTAYEVLREYDFPIGILPKGVTSYELNKETGEFSVNRNGSCSFSIESYELKYRPTITGVISKGNLANLKGVSVRVLLVWVNIVEVTHDGGDLSFSVGIASASFPIDNFNECPQCGCGFDCNNQFNGLLSTQNGDDRLTLEDSF